MVMSCLYVTENGSKVGIRGGHFVVDCKDGTEKTISKEILESIVIFGSTSLTVPCMKECMEKGITVSMFSTRGKYFGRLESITHMNAKRLKQQIYLSDQEEMRIQFSKKVILNKIHNQRVVLGRYKRYSKEDIQEYIHTMKIYENKISQCNSVEQIMGYEGNAARQYFTALSKIVKDEFKFSGRNKRPPKDAFNSMLSLGYTILMYEIMGEIENRGISPYIGFMHKDSENHPTLASDLLEEWRAVIVDATVLSLIQGNEIDILEFSKDEETGAMLLSKKGINIFIRKIENKMQSMINYLEYLEHPVSFRRAIWWQVSKIIRCIDEGNFDEYKPVRIR
jgi:CRISPR-associated protein Cas1